MVLLLHLELDSFKFQSVKRFRNLKTGKAAGLDIILPRLLKNSANTVATPLKTIINASLRQGRLPDDSKSPQCQSCSRRAVHKQIGDYPREHNILNPYQRRFRKDHSTEFAALSFSDTIRRHTEQGQDGQVRTRCQGQYLWISEKHLTA